MFSRVIECRIHGFILGVIVSATIALIVWGCSGSEEKSGAVLLSPDGRHFVTVVSDAYRDENLFGIDNNYRITVTDVATDQEEWLFRTPDEGRPADSLRAVWSGDSKKVLVVGRNVYVDPEVTLANGDIVYLEFDVETQSVTCNASQSRLPRVETSPANMKAYGVLLADPK